MRDLDSSYPGYHNLLYKKMAIKFQAFAWENIILFH